MRRRLREQSEPKAPGVIEPTAIYTLAELRARLNWGDEAVSAAQRAGLKLVSFGRQKFCFGSDALAFFERLRGAGEVRQ